MPLRRTKGSDDRPRPRWKDGSHDPVESTHTNASRCDGAALEPNPQTEPLVDAPQLLERSHEHGVSTRDRPARTGADARIEESAASGEFRLALRPYGRENKPPFLRPITYEVSTSPRDEGLGHPYGAPFPGSSCGLRRSLRAVKLASWYLDARGPTSNTQIPL